MFGLNRGQPIRQEPALSDDLPFDQRERLRLLKFYSGNLEAAAIAWSNHTHFQWGRWLVESGRWRDDV